MKTKLINHVGRVLLLAVATVSASGCSSSEVGVQLAPVSGTVMEGGQPVANAIVEFFPTAGRASVGRTDATGNFELKYSDELGAVVGQCRVQITPGAGGNADAGEDVVAPPMQAPPKIVKVPGTVTIQDGANAFAFDLSEYKT